MIIDVHPDDLKSLKELCKNGFFSGKIDVNLPVKVEEIS